MLKWIVENHQNTEGMDIIEVDREFDFESFGFTDRNEDIRRDKLDPYYNSVDSLMRRLDGKSESFNTARRILREAKNVIENNY